MHFLKEIYVQNFRSCMSCNLPLSSYTPIVGYNNGGKSNLLESIKWLLRKWTLQESDFFNSAKPVIVEGRIEGISKDVLDRLESRHKKRIEPMIIDGCLKIRRTQPSPRCKAREINLDIFDPNDEDGVWRDNPTGIDAAISALFPEPIHITAMDDAAEDVGKTKTSTTIGKLISELTDPISERHGGEIKSALDDVRNILEAEGKERAPELVQFDEQANKILKTFFPGIRVAVHVPPPEIVDLFKGGTIRVFEGEDAIGREVSSMGHGAQRSIQMALVRYLAERKSQEEESVTTTLLLIDEPELYLHPTGIDVVRDALKRLSEANYQVVFTTHSPQMVHMESIADTLIIRKDDEQGTLPLPTVRDTIEEVIANASHQAEVLFEFQNAAQILFADRVLLMEGKTERRLLPLICRLEGYTPPGDGSIALIAIGGSGNIPKALKVLEVMGIPAQAVVDLDFAFRTAVDVGWVDRDSVPVSKCLAILNELEERGKVELAEDGLPCSSSIGSAEDGFALLAIQEEAFPFIRQIHRQLKGYNIWVWQRGSFEHHLGVTGKGERTWGNLAAELKEKGCAEVLSDYEGIQELIQSVYG